MLLGACLSAHANDVGLSELAEAVRAVAGADGFAQLSGPPTTASIPSAADAKKARIEAALAALERAPELSRQSAAGRYAQSRLLEQLGRMEEALAALPDESALPKRVAIDVRSRRAQHLATFGRCEEAQVLWVLLEDALPPAAIARARAKCLPAVTSTPTGKPAVEPPLTLDARLQKAEKLTEEGRGEEALALIDAVRAKDVPKAQRARFTHTRGMALFRMRTRYAEASRVLAAAAALKGPTSEEDAFMAARALARADQDRAAIRAFRAFAKKYGTSRRASEALYLAAWLEMRNGKTDADKRSGEDALARWLEGPHAKAQPTLAAEALFDLGMRALTRGDEAMKSVAPEGSTAPPAAMPAPTPKALPHYARASQHLGRYAEVTTGCLERGRGFYWGAYAELAQGHRPQAVALYAEAVKSEPLCWYALLARKKLEVLGEPAPAPYGAASTSVSASAAPDAGVPVVIAPLDPALPTVFAAPLPADVAFYAALGFDAEAVAALRKQEADVQASVPPGLGLPTLVRAYHALGEHARPRSLVHQAPAGLLTAAPGAHNGWAFAAAYARPHAAFVQARASADGVDPELIYAVMLKESTFDPSVTSNADAIGLMQLLPQTGKAVGKSFGLSVTRHTLFDPRANILLGTRLLKQLLARYSGQMPLAVAAYNAGEHRVDGWLTRARRQAQGAPIALDRFVEEIPIDQTRNYVRRVMAFYARYEYLQVVLARDAAPTQPPPVLTLPEAVQ